MADFGDVPSRLTARLIDQAPLCWIVPRADPGSAILMPVTVEADANGAPASLLGHLPRRAPATKVLADTPGCLFLFLGANSYIPPSAVGHDDWGPTWNFVSAKLEAEVVLDEALTGTAVDGIVEHMEGTGGWRSDKLGDRRNVLLCKIIGFRANITAITPRMKLAQDETAADRGAIHAFLDGHPLQAWMDDFAD